MTIMLAFGIGSRLYDACGRGRDRRRAGAAADRAAVAAKADGLIDARAVLAAWEEALAVPEWDGPVVWARGDLINDPRSAGRRGGARRSGKPVCRTARGTGHGGAGTGIRVG